MTAIPGTVTIYPDFVNRITTAFPIITHQNWTLADIVEHCGMSEAEFDALNPGAPALTTDVVEGDTWNVVVHIPDGYVLKDVDQVVVGFPLE